MREFPAILECARDVETLCPDAWLINYINPSAIHGIGLRRYAPQVKSFALCDGLHMPHVKRYTAQRAGIVPEGAPYDDEGGAHAGAAYLVLGSAETTLNLDQEFVRVRSGRTVFYQVAEG